MSGPSTGQRAAGAETARHARLLAPLDFGFLTLRNRIVMGAMHTRIETLDRVEARFAAFFGARARGEAGLILTGGFAPNREGRMESDAPVLQHEADLPVHRAICEAVHREGGRVVMQILHAGRYAKFDGCVGPSDGRARINAFTARALRTDEVWRTIADFANTAALARQAGYDGVEIMGSEGYLINEFCSPVTNARTDAFGGSRDNRFRLATEVVKAVRAAAGEGFLVVYRISSIDLVEGGMSADEVADLARRIEQAGADLLNTGVGWHESPVPTIAASVPRAAWAFAIRRIKAAVSIPVIASNRINDPDVAEQLLADGVADLVSMARPLLADPAFARKVREGRADEINTCIGCNQACLDFIFTDRTATCLVNPRAGREIEFDDAPAARPKRIAVVGAGPAGLAFAIAAAERGHRITLYEAGEAIGGQFDLARRVPGKAEFGEAMRYFGARVDRLGIDLRLATRPTADDLAGGGFDAVVVATGVRPRVPAIPGIASAKVSSYPDVLSGRRRIGATVAIIGAGGIGFDVAEFLVGDPAQSLDPQAFLAAWRVDPTAASGGLMAAEAGAGTAGTAAGATVRRRQVTLLQRKPDKPGAHLGKSTGWILKAKLRDAGVAMLSGVTYEAIDARGLHVTVGGKSRLLEVDDVVVCAGQDSEDGLQAALRARGVDVHLIGGARQAGELDALRAIDEAVRLAVAV